MYLGRIVESGDNEVIWTSPRHPYTRSLAASTPTGAETWRADRVRDRLEGEPPSPFEVPAAAASIPAAPSPWHAAR
ncbi:hypothetical protein BH23CHL8_BH23CHL8_26980 [soil metagenome]